MTAETRKPPRSYWIVSGLALLWNLVGVAAYLVQVTMTPEAVDGLPEAQRDALLATPAWATAAFGTATTAGVLGCVLLLARSSWAVPLFLLSLAAVLVQMYHAFVIADALSVFGASAVIQPALVILIGVALIWYSRNAKEKGYLR